MGRQVALVAHPDLLGDPARGGVPRPDEADQPPDAEGAEGVVADEARRLGRQAPSPAVAAKRVASGGAIAYWT